MVEGHQVHRVARLVRLRLVGKRFRCVSPNKRFQQGANAIDGVVLTRIEAIGKNLFAFFGPHVVHIHFGMSGRWAIWDKKKDDIPEPTSTTRLRMENDTIVSHLSAMTVAFGDNEFFEAKKRVLGEDPLRDDSNPDVVWEKVSKSKKPIGLLVMDQSYIAGIGNIYRAEILFKAGVNPNTLGKDLDRGTFERIWMHSVDLLQRGFQTGSILTVDLDEARTLGMLNLRRYIYNRTSCARCKSPVLSWNMAGRTCYACSKCQLAAMSSSSYATARVFKSHCASDALAERLKTPEKLTVKELREQLAKHAPSDNLNGFRKVVLIQRYRELVLERGDGETTSPHDDKDGLASSVPVPANKMLLARPGTSHLKQENIADPHEAALEKQIAGEKRNVEHVAEVPVASNRRRLEK